VVRTEYQKSKAAFHFADGQLILTPV